MTYAPIVLFVYNRLWHTQQTIEALQKNELASDSELFIYSDAPKAGSEQSKVQEVRNYIHSIDGFKKVTIIEREKNWGLADSIIDGVTEVVNQYGKIIVLEDDIVTSRYFLAFMNDSLEFYLDKENIMSVSGYTYNYDSRLNKEDVFLFYGASSWGWATWVDRWSKIDFEVKDFNLLLRNKSLQKKFNRGGDFLFDMLKAQMRGEIDSWAVRFSYGHSKNNSFCLFPSKSMVQNIGHDNTGTHCQASDRWNVVLQNDYHPKPNNVSINNELARSIQKKLNLSFYQKIRVIIRELIK